MEPLALCDYLVAASLLNLLQVWVQLCQHCFHVGVLRPLSIAKEQMHLPCACVCVSMADMGAGSTLMMTIHRPAMLHLQAACNKLHAAHLTSGKVAHS